MMTIDQIIELLKAEAANRLSNPDELGDEMDALLTAVYILENGTEE